MKNLFIAFVFTTVGTYANATPELSKNQNLNIEYDKVSCTVTYTDSHGVTFSATAETCIEAYEAVMPFIEAQ